MSLTLPKNIILTHSSSRERELVKKFRQVVEAFERKIESPIHVSDLINPRKGYWQRVEPKTFDDKTIMYFSLGYAGHEALLEGHKDSGTKVEDDLAWSPDGMTDTAIVEVKITTKRNVAVTQSEMDEWLQQVIAYMAQENKTLGEIWVWYVSFPEYPKIAVFKVKVTPQALAKYRKQVKEKVKNLRKALDTKDHTVLELCSKKYCYRSSCKWYDACQPEGRWKPIKNDKQTVSENAAQTNEEDVETDRQGDGKDREEGVK